MEKINFKKMFICVFATVLILIVGFYFLAGDQLHYRESRSDIPMPGVSDSVTDEVSQQMIVEQTFTTSIQRLYSVSVKVANFYGKKGELALRLENTATGELMMYQTVDVSKITEETQDVAMHSDTPFENLYNVPLKITVSSNSKTGEAVSVHLLNTPRDGNTELFINGEKVNGEILFSASGEDYIWTGKNYWYFAVGFVAVLLLAFLVIMARYKKGKRSYIIGAILAVKKYKFLIQQLVSRDFKTKYRRSVLGVFWSFLNPLLMMVVQYFVFSTIFKTNIENYPVYLLVGIVSFNFFSEACSMTLMSILGNASLITKVYMPKYIYPLTRTMSSVINLSISFIPLILVALITGVRFTKAAPLALFFFACFIIFALGMGMLLAASMVFFRDTQFLWGVLSMVWMYATPIFYPESILPEKFRFILKINPLHHFISNTRLCIISGISPEPMAYVKCFLIAVAMLVIGALVFKKAQDKFVLYL